MSVRERRSREREQRHQLIVTAARELAESEGWDAVTTRRLAERIEYSQPVLYSHFAGKTAIVAAVALEGFAELAGRMTAAAAEVATPADALAAVVGAYAEFAERNPAVYDAMFTLSTDLPFARPDTPAAMHAAFGAMRDVMAALAGDRDLDVLTEVGWSALHGLVTLTRGGRLPVESQGQRLAMLVTQLLT